MEQLTLDKTGDIALRQLLDEPTEPPRKGPPFLLLVAGGVVAIVGISVGVVFGTGVIGGDEEPTAVPLLAAAPTDTPTPIPPTERPAPTDTPAVVSAEPTSLSLADTPTPVPPTATATLAPQIPASGDCYDASSPTDFVDFISIEPPPEELVASGSSVSVEAEVRYVLDSHESARLQLFY